MINPIEHLLLRVKPNFIETQMLLLLELLLLLLLLLRRVFITKFRGSLRASVEVHD